MSSFSPVSPGGRGGGGGGGGGISSYQSTLKDANLQATKAGGGGGGEHGDETSHQYVTGVSRSLTCYHGNYKAVTCRCLTY